MITDIEHINNGQAKAAQRIPLFDALRGLSVLSMVGFHFCYDLVELRGINLAWFQPPFEDVWRASISWVFLALAGIMCSFSSNNLKRAARYGFVALAIWAVTTIAAVDVPISFGIIYCMAASTFIFALLQRTKLQPKGVVFALICFACFLVSLNISRGYLQILGFHLVLPSSLYASEWLSWLGFPGPHFSSGDYYPLLPYCLMYMTGASLGPWFKSKIPGSLSKLRARPIEFIGRHALEIYILHQPILLLLANLF